MIVALFTVLLVTIVIASTGFNDEQVETQAHGSRGIAFCIQRNIFLYLILILYLWCIGAAQLDAEAEIGATTAEKLFQPLGKHKPDPWKPDPGNPKRDPKPDPWKPDPSFPKQKPDPWKPDPGDPKRDPKPDPWKPGPDDPKHPPGKHKPEPWKPDPKRDRTRFPARYPRTLHPQVLLLRGITSLHGSCLRRSQRQVCHARLSPVQVPALAVIQRLRPLKGRLDVQEPRVLPRMNPPLGITTSPQFHLFGLPMELDQLRVVLGYLSKFHQQFRQLT